MRTTRNLLLVCAVVTLAAGHACASWTFVQDRLNNPTYDGVSGLSGEASGTMVHIWGTNSGTPPGYTEGPELWPGLAAVYDTRFSLVSIGTTASLTGSGLGFCNGVALWQDARRYVIYGLDSDATSGLSSVPSRWTALGGWSHPDVMPTWTCLGGPMANPTGEHTYRVDYDGSVVRFWLDGQLTDTLTYPMVLPSVRLVAYAAFRGDSVDATFSGIAVSGTPAPEPSAALTLLCGFGAAARRRATRSVPR